MIFSTKSGWRDMNFSVYFLFIFSNEKSQNNKIWDTNKKKNESEALNLNSSNWKVLPFLKSCFDLLICIRHSLNSKTWKLLMIFFFSFNSISCQLNIVAILLLIDNNDDVVMRMLMMMKWIKIIFPWTKPEWKWGNNKKKHKIFQIGRACFNLLNCVALFICLLERWNVAKYFFVSLRCIRRQWVTWFMMGITSLYVQVYVRWDTCFIKWRKNWLFENEENAWNVYYFWNKL